MSHIHIPDGVIPAFWAVAGYIATGVILAVALTVIRNADRRALVPRIGVMAALMMAAMSVPLGFIPYHVNLTALTAVTLGPWAGFIAVFITNLMLALVVHGGITTVGLNTLVIGAEVFAAWAVFRGLLFALRVVRGAKLGDLSARTVAGIAAIATIAALVLSTSLMVGVVALTQVDPSMAVHIHEGSESGAYHDGAAGTPHDEADADTAHGTASAAEGHGPMSLGTFARIVFSLALPGWIIEGLVVASLVAFLVKVRPQTIPGLQAR